MKKIDTYIKKINENFITSHFFLCLLYLAVLIHSAQFQVGDIFTRTCLIFLVFLLGVFALVPLQQRIWQDKLKYGPQYGPSANKNYVLIYVILNLVMIMLVMAFLGPSTEFRMLFAVPIILISLNCEWLYGLFAAIFTGTSFFIYDHLTGNLFITYEKDIITMGLFLSLSFTVGKISENKRLLASRLLWERALAKNLLDNIPMAIIASDVNGMIMEYNTTAPRLIELPPDATTGIPEEKFWKEAGLDPAIFSGKEICNREVKCGDKYFLVNRKAMHCQDDTALGTVTILHDITQRRHYEEKMKRVYTLSAMGEMAAVAAHEIKNPLTTIHGFVQLFTQRPEKRVSELKEHFDLLFGELDRINKIVNDFLQLARPRKAEPRPLSACNLLQNTLNLVAGEASNRKVKLTGDIPQDLPEIYGDEGQLRQVLLNLVQNAIQACPLGGLVRVSGRAGPGPYLWVTVEDSGDGIPEELKEKLFQPFFTTKETGTGLGLAISRRIVREHGGEIEVHNSPLGGAQFLIKLPLHTKEQSLQD
jgi:two-component system sensor histidine kinase AtoS